MDQQTKLLNELVETIDGAVNDFNSSIPAIQKSILNKIILLVKDLDISPSGQIKNSVKNLRVIGQLKSEIEKIVLNPKYLKQVKKFAEAFSTVANIQHQYFNSLSDDFTPSKLLAEIQKQAIGTTIDRLTEVGLNANVTQYVQEILRVNITTGANFSDLVSQMRTALLTSSSGAGALERYTKTIVVDSLNTFNRQYAAVISDDLGWVWYQFIGTVIETTREWCEWMVKKKYVHKSELPEILKGKILNHQVKINPKTSLWYGAKETTTLSNIIDLAGGHSCAHAFAAIPVSLVPADIRAKISATG